jgi:hypothetical protein
MGNVTGFTNNLIGHGITETSTMSDDFSRLLFRTDGD